jgi:hypothetical protein
MLLQEDQSGNERRRPLAPPSGTIGVAKVPSSSFDAVADFLFLSPGQAQR